MQLLYPRLAIHRAAASLRQVAACTARPPPSQRAVHIHPVPLPGLPVVRREGEGVGGRTPSGPHMIHPVLYLTRPDVANGEA